MHLNSKLALYCATAMFFLSFSGFGQEQSAPATKNLGWQEATKEEALERKLGEAPKKESNKKKFVKSVTEKVSADDPSLTPREREIKLRARELELQEELKKLEERKRKLETPSERKARKEIERQEKLARRAERGEQVTTANAEVTGCPEGTVWVSRRATQRSSWRVMVLVRITNTGALPIDVESPLYGGVLVRDLCSGGGVTLSFTLGWADQDQVQIPLTAISRPPDGGLATDQFFMYISKFDIQSNRVRTLVWQTRLIRQYQTH